MRQPLHVLAPSLLLGLALIAAACSGTKGSQREPGPRYASFEGLRVYYEDLGPAAPEALVLVHGWACDRAVWRFQTAELAQHARVIALDLPGHGESEGPREGYTMDFFARSIAAVLDHAGVRSAVLAGHSNGTPVVRQFYRRFPDRTAGLIAVDGPLRPMFTPEQLDVFVADIQGKDSREKITQFLDGMLKSDMDPDLRRQILATMLATPRSVMVDSLEHSGDREIWSEDPIEVPLLVVVAESPFWTGAYENFVHMLAPGVDYRTFRGTGHFVMIDDPGGFNDAVLEFLETNRLLAE